MGTAIPVAYNYWLLSTPHVISICEHDLHYSYGLHD